MTKLLNFFSGKKTTIGAILALIITYSLTKGYIDNDLAILLNSLLVVLGLTVNIAWNIAVNTDNIKKNTKDIEDLSQ